MKPVRSFPQVIEMLQFLLYCIVYNFLLFGNYPYSAGEMDS